MSMIKSASIGLYNTYVHMKCFLIPKELYTISIGLLSFSISQQHIRQVPNFWKC